MEAFAAKQLQVSGRHVSATPRLGLSLEPFPRWLRLRARHLSRGLALSRDVRALACDRRCAGSLFSFRLGGHERRVSLSVAGDFASRYKNAGLSVGFWN